MGSLPTFIYDVQSKDSQAPSVRKFWSILQGCLAFAGLTAGAAAWLSVASNVALLTVGDVGAIASIVAIAIFAVASLVIGFLGEKTCHKKNQRVHHRNRLFNHADKRSQGEVSEATHG